MNEGLFCQLITLPLLKDHQILVQVTGHASHTVKLLPTLVISEEDCAWIERSFEQVIAEAHQVPGAAWSLGKTLAGHAMKARKPKILPCAAVEGARERAPAPELAPSVGSLFS